MIAPTLFSSLTLAAFIFSALIGGGGLSAAAQQPAQDSAKPVIPAPQTGAAGQDAAKPVIPAPQTAAGQAPQQTPAIAPNVKETPVPPQVVLPPPARPSTDSPHRPLNAGEAVRIALRNQPNIAIARAGISAAQGRTQQVRSGLLPTLSLSAGYTNVQTLSTEGRSGAAVGTSSGAGTGTGTSTGGTGSTGTGTGGSTGTGTGGTGTGTGGTTGGTTGGGTTGTSTGTTTSVNSAASGGGITSASPGTQAAVNLRQLIFDFNHTRDLVRQSTLQERVAEENLARVQSDLVLQVKQAFYLYVQNSRLVTVSEDNLANRQAQLALARARLNSGLGLPSDVVTAETAVSEAVNSLTTAQGNATLARINLALNMGLDARTPIEPADSTEPPLTTDNVEGLVTTALRQRPEILQAQASLNSARYGVNAAKTTSAPSIAANLGFSTRGEQFPPGNDNFSIGVSVQWNAFDGGLTAGRVKEARANVDTASAQLNSTQLTVVSDVSQAYTSLRTAEQRVGSAQIEVANAQEGVRIAEGRFRSGLGLFLDIINAQTALVTARNNLVNAQYGVDQARSALSRAIGAALTSVPR